MKKIVLGNMEKIVLAIFLLLIISLVIESNSSNATAKERMMTCDEGTFKYVKKLIFKDKVYERKNNEWVEWLDGMYDIEVYGKQYTAFFMDIRIQFNNVSNKAFREELDFILLKHTYKIKNINSNPPVETVTFSDGCTLTE